MPSPTKDGRRLTGYSADTHNSGTQVTHISHESLYDDSTDEYEIYQTAEDDADDNHDSDASVLSIPDENINFDLVYALHSFAATVEGQATVVKGDDLTLLDDSNSYWWLVKVLKTSEIGYIPAENIETPFERLARLNSHRNMELTQGGIQDSFPTPSKTKSSNKKKVRLAKGVKFQAQVIFGDSDEEFAQELQEWQETIRTDSSTDSDDLDHSDADDDDGDSVVHHSYYNSANMQDARDQDTQQADVTLTPSEQQSATANANTNQRLPFKPTLDLELPETIKTSLTSPIAQDPVGNDDTENQLSHQANEKDRTMAADDETDKKSASQEQPGQKDKEKKEKTGLRKLLSRKDSKDKKQRKDNGDKRTSLDGSCETASLNSQSTSYSEKTNSLDYSQSLESSKQENQTTAIKIYGANVSFGAEYKYAYINHHTTTAELVQQILETFEIEGYVSHIHPDAHVDYFLTVKGVDGDEYTLLPLDKPLDIYNSLMAHLNTPMPSLNKARRISAMMALNDSGHMGGPKDTADDLDKVRFYLYSKLKRNDEKPELISIKAALFANDMKGQSSILKQDQARVDKRVDVEPHAFVGDVISLLLDKFHILNGVADGPDAHERIQALRVKEGEASIYRLFVCKRGQEFLLSTTDTISNVLGDELPPTHHRRTSNPDRSSISSLSSIIAPPQASETFFVLRRIKRKVVSEQAKESNAVRQAPPHKPVRQDTPMPRLSQLYEATNNVDGLHMYPSDITQKQASSPIELIVSTDPENQPTLYDEPESAVDVMLKLDEALNSLADTRNSNEMLTEAITNQVAIEKANSSGVAYCSSPHAPSTPEPRQPGSSENAYCHEQQKRLSQSYRQQVRQYHQDSDSMHYRSEHSYPQPRQPRLSRELYHQFDTKYQLSQPSSQMQYQYTESDYSMSKQQHQNPDPRYPSSGQPYHSEKYLKEQESEDEDEYLLKRQMERDRDHAYRFSDQFAYDNNKRRSESHVTQQQLQMRAEQEAGRLSKQHTRDLSAQQQAEQREQRQVQELAQQQQARKLADQRAQELARQRQAEQLAQQRAQEQAQKQAELRAQHQAQKFAEQQALQRTHERTQQQEKVSQYHHYDPHNPHLYERRQEQHQSDRNNSYREDYEEHYHHSAREESRYQQQPAQPGTTSRRISRQVQPQESEAAKYQIESQSTRARRRSVADSMLFCKDFGINDMMAIIRAATKQAEEADIRAAERDGRRHVPIRSEISQVFHDTYSRLDQIEKELDRLMADAVKVYCR